MERSGRSPTTTLPRSWQHRGYDVFVFDIRGSGENAQVGRHDRINRIMRHTFLRELGERDWTVDDLVHYDVPAILDYVERRTGHDRVNWVGHSLGGMLVLAYLELAPRPERIANFVGMGSTIIQAEIPQRDMLAANRGLRVLSLFASPGRLGRPLAFFRLPGMGMIDRFYYSPENVDRETISRFYGYTLEDTGPGALRSSIPTSSSATWSRRTARSTTRRTWARSPRPRCWLPATATSCRMFPRPS